MAVLKCTKNIAAYVGYIKINVCLRSVHYLYLCAGSCFAEFIFCYLAVFNCFCDERLADVLLFRLWNKGRYIRAVEFFRLNMTVCKPNDNISVLVGNININTSLCGCPRTDICRDLL